MALQKDITLDSGVVCSYVRVSRSDNYNNMNRMEVEYYLNFQARSEGKKPVYSHVFSMELSDLPSNNPVNYSYEQLKLLEAFSGAVDV